MGNKQVYVTCVVQMPIEKGQNRDSSIFTKYEVTRGSRVYASETAEEFKQVSEKYTTAKVEEPDYATDLVDQDLLELFEDDTAAMNEPDYVAKEVLFQGSAAAVVDTAAVLGDENAQAKQGFAAAYEGNDYIDLDDDVVFVFDVDLPATNLEDGTIIMQIVTLTNNDDPTGDKISVGCAVTVGIPDAEVFEWYGTGDMSNSATGTGTKYDEINDADKDDDTEMKKIEGDWDFYALQDSDLGFQNKVQNCEAILPVDKQGSDSSIFTTYTATLTAKIYSSKDDTEPINLSETTFDFTLTAPVYETEDWDANDETWMDDVENEWFELHGELAESTMTDSDGQETDASVQLYIDNWVNKELKRPDVLDFIFYTSGPSSVMTNGKQIFHYAVIDNGAGGD